MILTNQDVGNLYQLSTGEVMKFLGWDDEDYTFWQLDHVVILSPEKFNDLDPVWRDEEKC